MEERFANFRKTLIKIEELNHLEKLTTTEFGINGFADMSDEEFQKVAYVFESKRFGFRF